MQGTKGIWSKTARCALGILCACALTAGSAAAAAPQVIRIAVSAVSTSSATLEAEINPQGKATSYHFEYGTDACQPGPCTSIPASGASAGSGNEPVKKTAKLKELVPAITYHFRVVAENSEGEVESKDQTFTTFGPLAQAGLPDGRAYEQASPVDKNGGDAQGRITFTRSARGGGAISFGSTFGIPGGKGAQDIPTYLAKRGEGQAGWSTQGLLPPADTGQRAQVLGWLADFSKTFALTTKLGNPDSRALLALPSNGGEPEEIAPYTPEAFYAYAGASKDSSRVVFESKAKLAPKAGQPPIPAAQEGSSNVYVWDEASEELSLASVPNEVGVPLKKGAFAGPYDWGVGTSNVNLNNGGSARFYYTQDTHAVADDGSVFFTEAGTGQLYLRLNPTQPQSDMQGDKCIKPLDACTLHVSASKLEPSDPVSRPAAFMAASADGKAAFFTSSEKLTEDANTGPIPPEPAIGRADLDGSPASIDADFISERAVGVTVDGSHIYWADPFSGTIGRADFEGEGIDPDSIDPDFIKPGKVKFEFQKEVSEGVFVTETVEEESQPRYLAVDAEHVYWTNTGRLDENGDAVKGGGTIGRADLVGGSVDPNSIDPDFIRGASDPQGIAVNASHIYWANSSPRAQTIGRAEIDGENVDQSFFEVEQGAGVLPYGVALSGGDVYFTMNDGSSSAYIGRFPLAGGPGEASFFGKTGIRGIATDATYIYWAQAATDEEAIGRIPIADFNPIDGCPAIPSCQKEFIKKESLKGRPGGLAVDAAHIYWSVNGETPPSPGNDLYRYRHEGEELTDLTPDAGDDNGAEVKGVIGASEDGSRLYFVANGDLDGEGPAGPADCKGRLLSMSGSCNLYLWSGGESTLVARLNGVAAARNLLPTPDELFASYVAKTALLSADGRTLLFRSADRLTAYDNEGTPELYRYRAGDPEPLRCVSCRPSGEAAGDGPSLGSVTFPKLLVRTPASVLARNMSADGDRVFFETTEALVPEDTNGQVSCLPSGSEPQVYPACLDVYEWEAPQTGGCQPSAPGYSPQDGGCVYLISTGKSPYPSLFGDASASGDDVFFFTREGLVGQDKDELQDVYDARVGGGLDAQNPPPAPLPCEGIDSCHGPAPAPPPGAPTPASASFAGPGNPVPKHKKNAHKKKKKHKKAHHKKAHKKKAQHREAKANRRTGR